MPGYTVGPLLQPKDRPFRDGWEQHPQTRDGHHHQWETVLIPPPRRVEEVVRCSICHAPRCGHAGDEDPCMEIRHHRDPHMYLSGRIRVVGA